MIACLARRVSGFGTHGAVAQLVRAPDCRSGGCGFEPRRRRFHKSKPDSHLRLSGFFLGWRFLVPLIKSEVVDTTSGAAIETYAA